MLAPTTEDRQAIGQALDSAEPGFGAADIQQALILARSLEGSSGAGRRSAPTRVYLFSDGAFGDLSGLDAEGLDVRFVSVGVGADNQGITALAARPDPSNARHFQLFARVRNYADSEARSTLSLQVDGNLTESRQVELAPGAAQEFVFSDLPLGAKAVEARLAGTDSFALDNAAYAVLDVRRPTEVLLVSQGNLFLEKVLGLLPNSEVFRIQPRRYFSIDPDRYDVVVFDAFLPEAMPRGSVLAINPPESSHFILEGELRRPRIRRWERDDPMLQFVDLRDVAVARAQRIVAPGWAKTLIEAEDGSPLLFAGENEGRRVAVLPFDIRQSNLPLAAAFPIFMANVMGYLEPGGQVALRDLRPGDALSVAPLPQAEEVVIRRPSGPSRTFRAEGRPISFDETREPGLYAVSQRAAGQTILEEPFAINASDEMESDIRPRAVSVGAGLAVQTGPAELVPVNREIWTWLVPAALALLLFEWFWFHRRS